MAVEADSVLACIGAGRWRSALFTSYTLSLTYVESHVIPRLARSGCNSVDVLVDLVGYRDSLAEKKASSVGREYALIPVQVHRGIFHPKLVHLWAESGDEDLLLVGSGNLTYSGHGGNIEVLEVLQPKVHARAMRQTADFIEGLATHPEIGIADTTALLRTMERLREVASRGSDMGEVQFIHSLDNTGGRQFVDAARALGGEWDELLVLSPYHHPAAEPVLNVAKELAVQRLSVGVSPRSLDTTAFPFGAAVGQVPEVRAVVPVLPEGHERAFHAKWIEARGSAGALALTGSFNATTQSLASNKNVECGVLRTLPAGSSCWSDVPQPRFRAQSFPLRAESGLVCLFVEMAASGQLTGRVLGQVPAGQWHAILEAEDRTVAEGDLELTDSLEFKWSPAALAGADLVGDTLRLTLEKDSRVARGWVSATRILGMNPRKRNLLESLSRLQRGATNEDDLQCVLAVLAEEANALTAELDESPSPAAPSSNGSERPGANNDPEPAISREEFLGAPEPMLFDPGTAVTDVVQGRGGWTLLRHIVAALLALPVEQHSVPPGTGGSVSSATRVVPSLPEGEPSGKALRQQLHAMEVALEARYQGAERALARAKTVDAGQRIAFGQAKLLSVWNAVVLRIALLRLNDVERTLRFHFQWQSRVGKLLLKDGNRDILVKQFCGVTAALAWSLRQGFVLANNLDKSPKHLHRWLDRFFWEGYDRGKVLAAAKIWLSTEAGQVLVEDNIEQALSALDAALSIPLERRTLVKIFRDGLDVHEQEAVAALGGPSVDRLRTLLASKAGAKPQYSLVDLTRLHGCPACDRSLLTHRLPNGSKELDRELSWQLRHYGFSTCPHCKKHVLVSVEA